VALAVAEQRGRSGADLVAAVVAGCEVASALDRAAPEKRIIRTASHTYGGFAAAVTAARLLGLDEAGVATAIGYAANLAVTVQAGYEDHQYGLLARIGMIAAHMAETGAPAPLDAIEGTPGFFHSQLGGSPASFEAALAALGRDYALLTVVLKPFPGALNSGVGSLILAAMMAEHGIRPDQVVRIVMARVPESNDELKHAVGPFRDRGYASSSMPFALAATLLDGGLRLTRLDSPNDPEVLRLCRLVEFVDAVSQHRGYHRIEVHTYDGRSFVGEGDYRLLAKPDAAELVRLHGTGPAEADVARLATMIAGIAELSDIARLTDCLRPQD
jgi:2-methylcitrate dehydratase PrpD